MCGPGAMPETITAALVGAGVATDRVHTERFAPGRPVRHRPARRADPDADDSLAAVSIRFQGRSTLVTVAPGESILRAGLEARPDLPWSCEAGVCALPCTCDAGQTLCGDVCVDLTSDAANCGTCGGACNENETCSDGACASCI